MTGLSCSNLVYCHSIGGKSTVVADDLRRSTGSTFVPHLHDTSGCQTALTTGWTFVYTIQPVVKPVVQPDERTATVHSTGCQTGLYNQFDNRLYTIQLVVKLVVIRV